MIRCSLGLVLLLLASTAPLLRAQTEEKIVYEPGVDVRFYWVGESMSRVPRLVPGQTPNVNWLAKNIDISGPNSAFEAIAHKFVTICAARLEIPRDGLYEFRLTSDDGSYLLIDGKKVIDHDGLHGATTLDCAIELSAGHHSLEVHHFENEGDWRLALEWRPPGVENFSLVDERNLSSPKGLVRVVAPGKKNVMREFFETVPGDRRPLTDVHPSYDLLTLHPDDFHPKVGGMDFLPDGRLIICCWEPEGRVFIIDHVDEGNAKKVTVKKIAEGLAEPLGLKVVGDRIFVLQKQELTELIDRDGDEIIDEYRCLCDDWHVSANFHEFAFGLVEKEGWLYFNLAIAIDPGGRSTSPQVPDRGRSARVNIATGALEFLCWGLRTPNGVGLGPEGEIFITDNQGDWLPSSKLLHLVPGSFYEQRAALPADWQDLPVKPPVVWMPQNEIGNSPGSPALFTSGPYAGQFAICEVTHGGINRVFVEKVADEWQGAIFRFCQGFEGGLNRIVVRPNGDIYAGGIGSTGNWGQDGKQRFGLQRIRPNGRPCFEMSRVESKSNGFLITLSEELDPACRRDLADFVVQSFTYEATSDYGGPKRDLRIERPKRISLAADSRSVFIELEAQAGRIYYFLAPAALRSVGHRGLWGTEAWYTLNAVSDQAYEVLPGSPAEILAANSLTEAESAAGWKLLFDGKSGAAMRGFRSEEFPLSGWKLIDGELVHEAGAGGGDLITRDQFADFEFECDWKVAEGGNSGIMYRVSEQGDYSWSSGPEFQLLDDQRHPDAVDPRHRAGSLYGLAAASRDVVRPAGSWNHARIVVQDNRVEHWLNGVMVVRYDLDGPWFASAVAASKFKDMKLFGKTAKGHIAFQDHGDEVRFRNLKIRALD